MQQFSPARQSVVEVIDSCAVFDAIDESARTEFVDAFDGVRLETGEVLMREGDEADALYVVRHGRLRTEVLDSDGQSEEIGQIGKGEVVGEMALITDAPRTATVTAMRDTELYRLPAEHFLDLTQRHPRLLRPFAAVVVERHRRSLRHGVPSTLPATVVLLPAPGVDVRDVAHAMQDAIIRYRVAVVDADDAAGRPDPAAWLLDIEASVDISILIADEAPTAWTRQCLRHADRVLLVVDEGHRAAPTPVEQDDACARRLAEVPVELVSRYVNAPPASQWLRGRTIAAHHNVGPARAADISRLVRRMTGDATVLVLGGGGARGFAHFGAIRGLLDAGVAIDAIVGTSAGALVGGVLARHGEIEGHDQDIFEWFDQVRWRRDLTPPTLALLTGRLMSDGFKELYGDRMIEDLAMDYVAVSTDLMAPGLHLHTSGPLWQAVRASAAVPGIFPPVVIDGTVLVDGGLVANVPVGVARARHGDARVIAVDVGDAKGFAPGSLGGSGVASGWSAWRRRGDGSPTLPKVLLRLTELGQQENTADADVLLHPDLAGFTLTETTQMHEIVRRGADAVAEALADGRITP